MSQAIRSTPSDNSQFERLIFESLVNEGKHYEVLHAQKPQFVIDEKSLREAAHAEVATALAQAEEAENKKRKVDDHAELFEQSNRDRNREHARNTRLRKKAYISKLIKLADQISQQNAIEQKEHIQMGRNIHEMQSAQKSVVHKFLIYRSSNTRNRAKWSTILDESIVFMLPITPYRYFHKGDISSSNRMLTGIDAMIEDTASLSLMAECVGQGSTQWKNAIKRNEACRVEYDVKPQDLMVAGDVVMCRYAMRLTGVEGVGGVGSCLQQGMLHCRFNKERKITHIEMMFDVMGYMQQLQKTSGITPENSVVANTVDMALLALPSAREAQALVVAAPPYQTLRVNNEWLSTVVRDDLIMQNNTTLPSLSDTLRVHRSQVNSVFQLADDCAQGRPGSLVLLLNSHQNRANNNTTNSINLTSKVRTSKSELTSGTYFNEAPTVIYLKLIPLTAGSLQITHFLAAVVDLPVHSAEEYCSLFSPHSCQNGPQNSHSLQNTNGSTGTSNCGSISSGEITDMKVSREQCGINTAECGNFDLSDSFNLPFSDLPPLSTSSSQSCLYSNFEEGHRSSPHHQVIHVVESSQPELSFPDHTSPTVSGDKDKRNPGYKSEVNANTLPQKQVDEYDLGDAATDISYANLNCIQEAE